MLALFVHFPVRGMRNSTEESLEERKKRYDEVKSFASKSLFNMKIWFNNVISLVFFWFFTFSSFFFDIKNILVFVGSSAFGLCYECFKETQQRHTHKIHAINGKLLEQIRSACIKRNFYQQQTLHEGIFSLANFSLHFFTDISPLIVFVVAVACHVLFTARNVQLKCLSLQILQSVHFVQHCQRRTFDV